MLLMRTSYNTIMLPRTGLPKGYRLGWGTGAWAGLAAYVSVYDLFALRKQVPTLSTAFYSFSSSKIGRPILVFFWFYLTAHLFRWIPRKYDVLRTLTAAE